MNYYHIHIKNTKKIHNAVQIILFNFKTRQNTIMVIRGQKSGYLWERGIDCWMGYKGVFWGWWK